MFITCFFVKMDFIFYLLEKLAQPKLEKSDHFRQPWNEIPWCKVQHTLIMNPNIIYLDWIRQGGFKIPWLMFPSHCTIFSTDSIYCIMPQVIVLLKEGAVCDLTLKGLALRWVYPWSVHPSWRVDHLVQLEARPVCNGDGCIPTQLERSAGVCLSSLYPHRQVHSESMRTEHHSVGDPLWWAQTLFPVLLDLVVDHPLCLPWDRIS